MARIDQLQSVERQDEIEKLNGECSCMRECQITAQIMASSVLMIGLLFNFGTCVFFKCKNDAKAKRRCDFLLLKAAIEWRQDKRDLVAEVEEKE